MFYRKEIFIYIFKGNIFVLWQNFNKVYEFDFGFEKLFIYISYQFYYIKCFYRILIKNDKLKNNIYIFK